MTAGSVQAAYDYAEAATLEMKLSLLQNLQQHIATTADKSGPTHRECNEASHFASSLLSRGKDVSDYRGIEY